MPCVERTFEQEVISVFSTNSTKTLVMGGVCEIVCFFMSFELTQTQSKLVEMFDSSRIKDIESTLFLWTKERC